MRSVRTRMALSTALPAASGTIMWIGFDGYGVCAADSVAQQANDSANSARCREDVLPMSCSPVSYRLGRVCTIGNGFQKAVVSLPCQITAWQPVRAANADAGG